MHVHDYLTMRVQTYLCKIFLLWFLQDMCVLWRNKNSVQQYCSLKTLSIFGLLFRLIFIIFKLWNSLKKIGNFTSNQLKFLLVLKVWPHEWFHLRKLKKCTVIKIVDIFNYRFEWTHSLCTKRYLIIISKLLLLSHSQCFRKKKILIFDFMRLGPTFACRRCQTDIRT